MSETEMRSSQLLKDLFQNYYSATMNMLESICELQ